MKQLFRLFFIFFKMGAVCFGGGYALLPLIEREIVEKYGYATNEEINDYFAIGQCTPGIIAVNVSTFVGYKQGGIPGAIFSTFGFVAPSIIIICIIASVLTSFSELAVVNYAFGGIRVCVCALIINAVIKFKKTSVVDTFTLIICIAVFILSVFTPVSPAIFVIAAGAAGFIIKNRKGASE